MSDIKEILKQSEQFEELVKEAQWGAAARLIGRGLLGGARAVGTGARFVGRGIGTGARAAGTAIRGGAQRIINLPQSIRAARAAEIAAVRAEAVAARTALKGSLYESILKSPHGKQAFKLNPQGHYVPNLNSKYWSTPHARGMLDSSGALKNDALQKLTSELATVKKLQTAGLKMKAIREAALASSTARIANIAAWNAFKAKLPAQAAKGAASLIGTVGLYYMFSGSDSPPPDASVDVQKLLSSTIPPQSSSQVNTASETIGQISGLTSALNQAKSGKSSSTVEAVDSYISSLSSISEDLKKLSSLSSISKSSMENYKAVASSLNSKISNSDRADKASSLADALNQANKADLAQQIENTETSLFQYSSAIQQAMTLG